MLRKLLTAWSEDRIERALRLSGNGVEISIPANDIGPRLVKRPADATLWIEDWTEQDEHHRLHGDHVWEGYIV